MLKMRNKRGVTLAELLVVVAIIGVLAGVAFVGVIYYMRSMTKLEYDGYAKEIFVAAQNHLSMAKSEGYLGRKGFGESDDEEGVYYFVVRNGAISGENDSGTGDTDTDNATPILDLMLPFGSVDETVRQGSYIIRYHKDAAQVLDVFFWSESNGRFKHTYSNEYADFLDKRDNKSALKTYEGDKSVIGYYGGVDAFSIQNNTETLKAPTITVKNAERLTVTVNNPNDDISLILELVVTGLSSGKSKTITLDSPEYVLDDITTSGKHFSEQFSDFWPGENITVQARVYSSDKVSYAVSNIETTNSLFADGTTDSTALISNIRHLENLDKTISGLSDDIHIANAKQTVNLDWNAFKTAIGSTVSIYPNKASSGTKAGCFLPVTPGYILNYDGQGKSISNINVDYSGDAGLFGALTSGSNVHDLKLVDFSISGTGNVGALAGSISGTTVTNVVAYHSSGNTTSKITGSGSGSAGGLIGSMTGGSVTKSAASLIVSSTSGDAGGLIGTASGGTITASYSGGHTSNGEYSSTSYNVTASGNAGGLIGYAGSTTVTACYSTCSAKGATVGGLVGTASGAIKDSYATGLVSGTTKGAFAGSLSGTASNCSYYEVINQEVVKQGTVVTAINCLPAVGSGTNGGISPLDPDYAASSTAAGTYTGYAGNIGNPAVPYDRTLGQYYSGKYNLKSIKQLGGSVQTNDFVTTHYGDWPAPEVFVVNK